MMRRYDGTNAISGGCVMRRFMLRSSAMISAIEKNDLVLKALGHLTKSDRDSAISQLGREKALQKLIDRALQPEATPKDINFAYDFGLRYINGLDRLLNNFLTKFPSDSVAERELEAARDICSARYRTMFRPLDDFTDAHGGRMKIAEALNIATAAHRATVAAKRAPHRAARKIV